MTVGKSLFQDDIIGYFADSFGISKKIFVSQTRKQEIVRARDFTTYILREYASMSFPAIGRLLGGRDHSTIIHAYKKVKKNVAVHQGLEQKFNNLVLKARGLGARKQEMADLVSAYQNKLLPKILNNGISGIITPVGRFQIAKISSRNMEILDLYRQGLTLRNIGETMKITHERVRQIANKTIRQLAINDSIEKGIIIDGDMVLDEERKKRLNAKRGPRVEAPTLVKEKRWSRYYAECRSCHTTSMSHIRHGLCEACSGQYRGTTRESIISLHKDKCDRCGIMRHEGIKEYGRDLYIMKNQEVLCQKCFRTRSGKNLGSYKNYEWSRSYQKCISCGTTSIPHYRKGLCEKCGNKEADQNRNVIISLHGSKCDVCKIERTTSIEEYGRDLYLLKDQSVMCKKCFLVRAHSRVRKNALQ